MIIVSKDKATMTEELGTNEKKIEGDDAMMMRSFFARQLKETWNPPF